MNNRFSLIFYFKKPKNYAKSMLPIYMRISVGCERTEISTKRTWDPARWNVSAGRATGKKEDVRELNIYLDTLQAKVYEAHRSLIIDNEKITVSSLRDKLLGKDQESRMLIEIFQKHNEQLEKLVGKDFAPGTLERYKTALSHTVLFLQWKYKKSDIDILDLSYEFVTDFEFWLKTERNCGHNTAIKYISNLRKVVNICLKHGWLLRDPFFGYKMTKEEVIREVLSEEELDRVVRKEFSTNRLDVIRDIFLFGCYTGLAYADIKKLKRTEIANGIDGKEWIFTRRRKTDTLSRIPLLSKALQIMWKYKDHPVCVNRDRLLPVPCNQKVNEYLKEIADVCGINKNLTFHIARHTFATTITLSNGVPIETVGKMLGHKSIKTTQHYAKILDKKISDDMEALRRKIDSGDDGTSHTGDHS